MAERNIKITKFANKIKEIIDSKKYELLDDAFDTIYTEFEFGQFHLIFLKVILDSFEGYKKAMISGVEKLLLEVKNFKKPKSIKSIFKSSIKNIFKSIINLKDAMDDTIKELKELTEEADIWKHL